MDKKTFITLQKEDITSLNNSVYDLILKLFDDYIPGNADIPTGKTVKGMYEYMETYAKKNNIKCIDPFDGFKKLMYEYLEIKPVVDEPAEREISLEDIFS